MNGEHTQFRSSDAYADQRQQRHPGAAIVLAMLGLPLLLVGIGLLIFTAVTLAGAALLVITLLLLLLGVGLLVAAVLSLVSSTVRVDRRCFSVTGSPQLVVHNEAGSISVQADADATAVTIKTTLHTRRFGKVADASWVRYEQSEADHEVRAEVERVLAPGSDHPQAIDFEITLPARADLELLTGVGDLQVTGVSGHLSLTSEIGSIAVSAGLLTGNSVLETRLGSITFQGGIDPFGTYQFSTKIGAIQVILPDDTAFELDASTQTGTITTVVPDMRLVYRRDSEVHGDAGLPPRSSLKLSAITGSVSVFEESDVALPLLA